MDEYAIPLTDVDYEGGTPRVGVGDARVRPRELLELRQASR